MPCDGGPDLPPRRRDGQPWPDWMQEKWEVVAMLVQLFSRPATNRAAWVAIPDST
jgi:hypothetical protein